MTMRTKRTDRADATRGFCHRLLTRAVALARRERGSSLVEFGLMLPFLGMLLLGVIDFGRAYYLSIEVNNAAYAGALYGCQNTSDTTGMQNAATSDAPDVSGMTATAYCGVECSDGQSSSSGATCPATPSCTSPAFPIQYAQVNTTATYTPIFHAWPGIPSSISLKGSAWVRAGQ
jgi:Flp pilus assembly protein TadG